MNRVSGLLWEAMWQLKQRSVRFLANRGIVEAFSVVLARQLAELSITHVIDVGANRGQYGTLLRRLGYTGTIVSFEPAQRAFDALRNHASKDAKWQVHKLALGDADDELELHVTGSDDFSSLLKPNDNCEEIFREHSQRREKVPVRRLGDLLPTLIPASHWSSTHLKLDTQGFDLGVIRGLGDAAESINSLQSELSVIPLYEKQPGYIEVLNFLQGRGFTPSCIFPVSRQLGLPIVEFDALFCRTKFGQPSR
jgi:FkbM family methyltransferase